MKSAQRHAPNAVGVSHLLRLGLLSASVLVLILLVMWWLWWGLLRRPALPAHSPIPPQPRLQAHPRADLAQVRALQRARLSGYHWIDRQAGIAQIPIERAMALSAKPAGRGNGKGRSP